MYATLRKCLAVRRRDRRPYWCRTGLVISPRRSGGLNGTAWLGCRRKSFLHLSAALHVQNITYEAPIHLFRIRIISYGLEYCARILLVIMRAIIVNGKSSASGVHTCIIHQQVVTGLRDKISQCHPAACLCGQPTILYSYSSYVPSLFL